MRACGPRDAFGLTVWLNTPAGACSEPSPTADIAIQVMQGAPPRDVDDLDVVHRDDVWLRTSAGLFQVCLGKRVRLWPSASATKEQIWSAFSTRVVAAALHQRGLLVLHGAVIEIDGVAVALLAGSGGGKSTLTGALIRQGHRCLADDMTVVRFDADGPKALAGTPVIKLSLEAAERLAMGKKTVDMESGKRLCQLAPAQFCPQERPVRSLVILGVDMSSSLQSLSAAETVLQMLRHTHVIRLLQRSAGCPEHFLRCGQLGGEVCGYQLRRPKRWESLAEAAALVCRAAG